MPKLGSPAAKKAAVTLAETIILQAVATQQTAVASAKATYAPNVPPAIAGGFVSPANWPAYDAAIKAADAARASSVSTGLGLLDV